MKGVVLADDAKRLGSSVSFGDFVSGSFGGSGVPDAAEFAKRLARDLVVDVSSVEAGVERVGRGRGRLAEEGVTRRSFGDLLGGAGLVAAGVLGSVPGVPGGIGKLDEVGDVLRLSEGAGDVAPVVQRLEEFETPFGRAIEMSFEDAWERISSNRIGPVVENQESVRMWGLSNAGAERALFNAGKNPSDDLGRFVVSEFTDFSIDPKNFPYSEDFLSVYRQKEDVPSSISSRIKDADVDLFALSERNYLEGESVFDAFEEAVNRKARLGKYESENYPPFFPAFRGRTPSYGFVIDDNDAILLIRDSVAMDALASAANRNLSNWAKFYYSVDKISSIDESVLSASSSNLAAKELKNFSDNYVPGALVVDRIADALRILFEPRIAADTGHLFRGKQSVDKPEFLWFGLFNNSLAIRRLEEVKSMLPSVSYSAEEKALLAFKSLKVLGGVEGSDFKFPAFALIDEMMPDRGIRDDVYNLMQNEVASMFRKLFKDFYDGYYGAGMSEENVANISARIDALTALLRDEGTLFEKMVTRGFSGTRPVRKVSVTKVEEIEPFAGGSIIDDARDNMFIGVKNIEDAIVSDGIDFPNRLVNAILQEYDESADLNPIVSIFSPFADADLSGSSLFAARLASATDVNMTAFYATSASDLAASPHATMANVIQVSSPISEMEAYNQAANVSQRIYNQKFNEGLIEGWTVPYSDAEVNMVAKPELAIVVRQIPIEKSQYGEVWSSVAEVEWYRLFDSRDEAEKWAVKRGNREIVEVANSNLSVIEDSEVADIELRISNDLSSGVYFRPGYKEGTRDISPTFDDPEGYDAAVTSASRYRAETGRPSSLQSKGLWMDVIAKVQGFDGLPSVVDSFEYGNLLAEGWRPVFRGVKPSLLETRRGVIPSGEGWRTLSNGNFAKRYSGEDYFNDFISGKYSAGSGIYSAGYYFAEEFGTALSYAIDTNGVLVAGLLPPYAKMAPTPFGQFFWQLNDEYKLALVDNANDFVQSNPEMVLAMLGYDGAYTNVPTRGSFLDRGKRPEMVLYNRTMLAVYEKPIRVQDFSESVNKAIELFPDLKESYQAKPRTSPVDFDWIASSLGPKMPEAISNAVFDPFGIRDRSVSEWIIEEMT